MDIVPEQFCYTLVIDSTGYDCSSANVNGCDCDCSLSQGICGEFSNYTYFGLVISCPENFVSDTCEGLQPFFGNKVASCDIASAPTMTTEYPTIFPTTGPSSIGSLSPSKTPTGAPTFSPQSSIPVELPTTATTFAPSLLNTTESGSRKAESGGSISQGAWIAIATTVGLAVFGGLMFIFIQRKRRQESESVVAASLLSVSANPITAEQNDNIQPFAGNQNAPMKEEGATFKGQCQSVLPIEYNNAPNVPILSARLTKNARVSSYPRGLDP